MTAARCTFGGRNGPRCEVVTSQVVQLATGKLRPRCSEHIGDARIVTPEEATAYFARREVLSGHNERLPMEKP